MPSNVCGSTDTSSRGSNTEQTICQTGSHQPIFRRILVLSGGGFQPPSSAAFLLPESENEFPYREIAHDKPLVEVFAHEADGIYTLYAKTPVAGVKLDEGG